MGSDPEQKFIDVVKGRALLERFEKAKPYSNDEMFAAGEWHSWAIENAEKFLTTTESFLNILGMLGEENARLTEQLAQTNAPSGPASDREELANLIDAVPSENPACVPSPRAIADAILAAGYRKVLTVTTLTELLELPAAAVIRTGDMGQIYELSDEKSARGRDGIAPGHDMSHWVTADHLPALVLYSPKETSDDE